ncbi:hypothetical protein Ancab_013445 [Ancistrocladus abbreviatus]
MEAITSLQPLLNGSQFSFVNLVVDVYDFSNLVNGCGVLLAAWSTAVAAVVHTSCRMNRQAGNRGNPVQTSLVARIKRFHVLDATVASIEPYRTMWDAEMAWDVLREGEWHRHCSTWQDSRGRA